MGQFPRIKNKITSLVLFFLIASQFCSCQKQSKLTLYVEPSSSKIDILLQEGNYEEVLNIYTKQLEEMPEGSNEQAGICLSIGDLYTSYIRDREKAIQYLEKAIEIDQKNQNELGLADDYYIMSNVFVEMGGSIAEGIEYANKAEELYKKNVGKDTVEMLDTLLNKGLLYYYSEQWERALENFEAVQDIGESIDVETVNTCIYIGKTLTKLKEYDRAEETLFKAQKLCKAAGKMYSSADAEYYLGRLYCETKDWDKAIESLKEALTFYETDIKYLYDAAFAYDSLAFCVEKKSGKWEEGMPYVIKACQSMEYMDSLTEEERSNKEALKQTLRWHFDKWKPKADDQDYEVWYQKAVLDGEGWEDVEGDAEE